MRATLIDFDPKTGQFILRQITDIEPYLRLNWEERKAIGKGFSQKRTLRKIGSIPIEALLSLPPEKAQAIMSDDRELKKFLRENPQFRTCDGEF